MILIIPKYIPTNSPHIFLHYLFYIFYFVGMYTMDLHNLKVENLLNSGLAFLTFVGKFSPFYF